MKKFLALLIVFISLPFCGWAAVSCSGFPVNNQDGKKNALCYKGDGFIELIIHFDTGVSSADGYTEVKSFLETSESDIGHIIIMGSADTQPYVSGNSFKRNVKLSKDRAKQAISLLPSSISSACDADSGKESKLCSVYVMGEANDMAYDEKENANVDERVARIYVIWKSAQCSATLRQYLPQYKTAFADCSVTKGQERLLDVCENEGVLLYGNKVQELLELLVKAGLECASIKKINNQTGVIVDNIISKIDAFVLGLDRTVWRDEDGNFNTARLASDSIAAVVLGTAGGIITSKLVKKNQIKKGFEDLNCSIGGQRVASYGDEFTVGLQ